MDAILSRVTQHAMNYAIRSGVTIATGYTIKQCGRLLQQTPRGHEREQIAELQVRLETKIKIISPAIDMIELISARGNTSLETAATLTRSIRLGIQELGMRLSEAVEAEGHIRKEYRGREGVAHDLLRIIADMKLLLQRIDDAVPLLNLAITISGASLSSRLSNAVSPSRLLQASTFLTSADTAYSSNPSRAVQVGPTFTVSLYMLFAGHALRPVNETGVRDTTWKEVIHKAQVKLLRLPLERLSTPSKRCPEAEPSKAKSFRASAPAAEYAYQVTIVEDLDDGRMHTFDDDDVQPQPFDGITLAGIREVLPIHEISKIFYADTGKILNIQGDSDEQHPILLLKRDEHAEPPRRMTVGVCDRNLDMSHPHDVSSASKVRTAMGEGRSWLSVQHQKKTGSIDDSVNSELSFDDGDGAQSARQVVDSVRSVDCLNQDQSEKHMPITPTKPKQSHHSHDAWSFPPGLDPEWIALEVHGAESSDLEGECDDDDSDDDDDGDHEDEQSDADSSLLSAFARLGLPLTSSPISERASPAINRNEVNHPVRNAKQPSVKTTLSLLEMLVKLAALQQFRQESHLAIEDELLNLFLQETATVGNGEEKAVDNEYDMMPFSVLDSIHMTSRPSKSERVSAFVSQILECR